MCLRLIQTDVHSDLLGELEEQGLFSARVIGECGSERAEPATRYELLINALIEQAREDGIRVNQFGGERLAGVECCEFDLFDSAACEDCGREVMTCELDEGGICNQCGGRC